MNAAEILQAIDALPFLERERIHKAILRDSSADELMRELRTIDPGDCDWDTLIEFAGELVYQANGPMSLIGGATLDFRLAAFEAAQPGQLIASHHQQEKQNARSTSTS